MRHSYDEQQRKNIKSTHTYPRLLLVGNLHALRLCPPARQNVRRFDYEHPLEARNEPHWQTKNEHVGAASNNGKIAETYNDRGGRVLVPENSPRKGKT